MIDLVRRSTLDRIHDFGKGIDLRCGLVHQRSEDKVHMIGHDDCSMKIDLCTLIVKAAIKRDRANLVRKNPPEVSAEGHEVRFEVTLQMWELTPVKTRGHNDNHVGTAALGCPAERSSAKTIIAVENARDVGQSSGLETQPFRFGSNEFSLGWRPAGQPRAAVPTPTGSGSSLRSAS